METPHETKTLRLASYNIHKARGRYWRRDPRRILNVINGLDADVIALQEADMRLGDRPSVLPRSMIDQHTDFDVVPLAVNDVSLGWHGNAVLVRRNLTVATTTRIELPGFEPRGAVAVSLTNGFTLIGVHLGLLRASRLKQLAKIADHLGAPDKVAVAGDMNEWSSSKGFDALKEHYSLHAPGRSFHASRPIAALDRIAISHDITLTDAGVDQSPLAKSASDHLPIWADISFQ